MGGQRLRSNRVRSSGFRFHATRLFAVAALLLLPAPALAADSDGDGVENHEDNCTHVPNPTQCDSDGDGFGNHCDGDFDHNGVVSMNDFVDYFVPSFQAGFDSGEGTDMDCNGTVNAGDFGRYFVPQYTQGKPGASGVNPARTSLTSTSGPCLSISANGQLVENVDIGPCGTHGISMDRRTGVTIRNVTIRDTGNAGVNIHRSTDVVVEDSDILNTYRQSIIYDKSTGGVARRNLAGWDDGGGWDGISVYNSSDVLVEQNEVYGGRFASGCGLIFDGRGQTVGGVSYDPPADNTFQDNLVLDFDNCGIGVASGSGNLVHSNVLVDVGNGVNGNVGIYVWDFYDTLSCDGNSVIDNQVDHDNPFYNPGDCTNSMVSGNSWQQP